jgi:flagellar hook-basal body complex protein FliE
MDSSLILSITTFIYGLGAFLYESVQNLVTGKHTNIHQTMIAAAKSSVAFEFMMQIRNKTIAAYDKIMNMPI